MIQQARVANESWAFTSRLYAHVNAGLIATRAGGIVIDTLLFPRETRQLLDCARHLCAPGIRYLINTQAAMDHSLGAFLFDNVKQVAHREARTYLLNNGRRNLSAARSASHLFDDAKIRIPRIVFDQTLILRLGDKSFHIMHAPGPTHDACVVYVPEERILFAGDLMMHVPLVTHARCDIEAYKQSLRRLHDFNLESIVQGHGEVLLKGEVKISIDRTIRYLEDVEQLVDTLLANGRTVDDALAYGPDRFGISPVPMSGLIPKLHRENIAYLWRRKDPRLERDRQRSRAQRRKAAQRTHSGDMPAC